MLVLGSILTQTTPWPPSSKNLKTRSIRLYTVHDSQWKGRLEHEQTGRNPNRSLNRRQLRPKPKRDRRLCRKRLRKTQNKNERTSKTTQTDSQLNHNCSGQRPKSHGEQTGNDPGGRARTTANEAKKQGNPNRSPTQPQQLRPKTQKPWRASGRQSRQERTRTKENKGVLSSPRAAAVTSTRVKVRRHGDWQTTQTE